MNTVDLEAKGTFISCDKSTDRWPKMNINDTQLQIEKARRAEKYLLIWDTIGTAPVYFKTMETVF